MEVRETGTVFVIVLDVNPDIWGAPESHQLPAISEFSKKLMIFINAFLLLNPRNRIAVISAEGQRSRFLFPIQGTRHSTYPLQTDLSFTDANQTLIHALQNLAATTASGAPRLSGALSKALCYMARQNRGQEQHDGRVLVISVSPDTTQEYVPMMNCLFLAQNKGIPVDSLVLRDDDSLLLQQASQLTNGIYHRPSASPSSTSFSSSSSSSAATTSAAQASMLLQCMLMFFLPGASTRSVLVIPQSQSTDYRATCFCHHRPVEQGYVCPVCLSIWCLDQQDNPSWGDQCDTCKTQFTNPNKRARIEKEKE